MLTCWMFGAFTTDAHAQGALRNGEITTAEAVSDDWSSASPPTAGWKTVSLPDVWDGRWPDHDGVVWYRLHWQQHGIKQPVGLLLDYVCLADVVYVNGSEIHRDPQLREPLSRSWIKPQYFLLSAPLLHDGDNVLLIRVSGLVRYQPGLGVVVVGTPESVYPRYQRGVWWRYDLQLFDQLVSLIFSGLFLMVWLLRRKDSSYGWYALSALLSFTYGLNYVVDNTWPFSSTDSWEVFNQFSYVAAASGFALFLLRYNERSWPRVEAGLLSLNALSLFLVVCTQSFSAHYRGMWFAVGGIIYYLAIIIFTVHALRGRRTDHRVLAACLVVPMGVSVHDFLVFYGVIRSDLYLLALASPLTIVGMGFALAYRFAAAMRRTEGFNQELQCEVVAATNQLGETLRREHLLALQTTRIGERLNLVRDLHDGFGGSLLGAIAELEQSHDAFDARRAIETLKELRDDLRLVIDTTTLEPESGFDRLLASLRHRWYQRFESMGIELEWPIVELDQLKLDPARSLHLLRVLQEALTNAFKHSRATRVRIEFEHKGRDLRICVADNGCGFDVRSRAYGSGLDSLSRRASSLGGSFRIESSPSQGTVLMLTCPVNDLERSP